MNSTETQPTLLELAKQGNAKAIATLMNRQLQPKGITTKAALKDGCLQVMLESAQAPNQQSLVTFVRKGITSLGTASIERVMVYGRQAGDEFPAWSEEFELAPPNPFGDLPAVPDPENQQTPQSISVEVEGVNGQIRLTKNRVIISRKGARAFLTQGLKGDKEIPISRITAIQFKPADNLINGYLQFSIQGGWESNGGVFAATQDENTIMFSVSQQPAFEEVKRYIDSFIDDNPISLSMLRLSELKATGIQTEAHSKVQVISSNNQQKPWYKRDFGIILLLIFFWPVGLYLMWKYSKWSTLVKWTLTAICSFMFLTAIS